MEIRDVLRIIKKQRAFFDSGATLPAEFRIKALETLKRIIKESKHEIAQALYDDLGKPSIESYMCETGMLLSEIDWQLKHIKKLSKNKRVPSPLAQFPSRSFVHPQPLGNVLIMSPWNYPVLLALEPAVDAIAAGNTCVIKPSAYAPNASQLIADLIDSAFPEDFVAVVTGGREENAFLLDQKWDKIFFTGSKDVGRVVLAKAAPHLTPCTLELGGKSPVIVDSTANIELAARRIVFGKFLNCGQTCVAPDYVFVNEDVKDRFVEALIKEIKGQFGDYKKNKDYGRIINEKHFNRILSLLDWDKIVCGGGSDVEELKIEPTVMVDVKPKDPVMQQEIFGPVLPVIGYRYAKDALDYINENEKPLAMYVFTENPDFARYFEEHCRYGGGCRNDVIVHLAGSHMGFGGVGESGMGSYHGKAGFDCFTHYKSVLDKKTWLDLSMRYQPYTGTKEKLINLFLK